MNSEAITTVWHVKFISQSIGKQEQLKRNSATVIINHLSRSTERR